MSGSLRAAALAMIPVVIWVVASEATGGDWLPGPRVVAGALWRGLLDGSLVAATTTSFARLLFGYFVALACGVPLGLALARVGWLKEALGPVVLGLSSVPSICWLPLAIVWLGLSEAAIQAVIVVGAGLPITVATEGAVRQVPPSFERAARTMGARGGRLLFGVVLFAALPGIVTGAKTGWTFALRSLMAGELLFVSGGLGQLLEAGRDVGDAAVVVGVMVVIVGASRAVERLLFGLIERSIGRRWGLAS